MKRAILLIAVTLCACAQEAPHSDILTEAQKLGYTNLPVSRLETSFLRSISKISSHVLQSIVLLKDHDRALSVFWRKGTNADFNALTASAFRTSSATMRDVIDTTVTNNDALPMDLLAFTEADQRFFFVRIQDTLYEFHVQKDQEERVFVLLQALTKIP